ncbi:hypothetical protein SAY87_025867 [Trapa incisa]|uniref:UDENN domain-containing protein n=2 Tax=Trapa TaxID=22665 RepID=A0AAN7LTI3_TRANT|nr:hypothetical protein SAY87_025867 [Trapa incisa]KAK4785856.1 hypothetical protein SAY86_002545 [Trapa natans]
MASNDESGSPGWNASFFVQTTEDIARAVAAAAAAATAAHSQRPSVVFSAKDSNSSQLQKLQSHFMKALKGFSSPPEVKNVTYNPEVLTSQKRQWANCQLQYLDQRSLKEPSRLFESMVVVGLHPNCDIQALHKRYISRKSEGSSKLRTVLSGQHKTRVEPSLEPQVLFVYPPEKQLPLKYKDLLSFCLPGGVEVNAVERTPSMSELNEILLGQEHLKQSDLSFVFRLQVADDSTLYGCCVLVDELVQRPSGLISMISEKQQLPSLSRYILTTRRCYCILSRLPFFELHFGVLNSIFTEERLERLTKGLVDLSLENPDGYHEEHLEVKSYGISPNIDDSEKIQNETPGVSESSSASSTPARVATDDSNMDCHQGDSYCSYKGDDDNFVEVEPQMEVLTSENVKSAASSEGCLVYSDDKQITERRLPNAVLPLLRYYQYESSESSSSFQSSPIEDRHFRSDIDDTETEEASFSGQDETSDHADILEWAKANSYGLLQVICEYYKLRCPARGSTVRFHPLEHLHPLEYSRPEEAVLQIAGSTIDMRSCTTSLELAEAHNAILVEEEATALSIWSIASICGALRLEHVLMLFAGALLEKQIVVVCSNLGILSASVLAVIPLIRPYQWQSLLMPILPNDMLDFLDAPVPYIVGVKNKTAEVQSKLTNAIIVDANKNQVKASSIPQLPKHKELFSLLSPYHAKLVGESYLGRKRPMYECTDVQIEAAKEFLRILRRYLDSLCSNLRSHTITNVQSNDDKVSLLLKESFIESFLSRDQPFMKHFVDTQLFSVHTDLVLSFIQKE